MNSRIEIAWVADDPIAGTEKPTHRGCGGPVHELDVAVRWNTVIRYANDQEAFAGCGDANFERSGFICGACGVKGDASIRIEAWA